MLDTGRTTYVVGLNQGDQLQEVYWGKVARDADWTAARCVHEHASIDSPGP